jgi:multicomponent Na+:H+ antiporter subunit B
MKLLPLMALLSVILLFFMFAYVVEDIPAFGDPNSPPNKYVPLPISIDAEGLVDSLDAGVVPAELKSEIERIGYTKENNFPALEEGKYEIESNEEEGGWDVLIVKGEKYEEYHPGPEKWYFIKEDLGGKLKVFRYSIPVRWQEKTEEETGLPNMVTSGLADYRGYDTMYEETVIFTAAISVILLLRRREKL